MYYTLDKVLWKTAAVQLGKAYHMPVAAECGGSMTYRYDQQNGAEGMLFMLGAPTSGAHLLSGIGSTYNAIGMSAEMMLIHTAWLASAQYLRRGIRTDESAARRRKHRRAGPGGNFLMDDLTLRFLRNRMSSSRTNCSTIPAAASRRRLRCWRAPTGSAEQMVASAAVAAQRGGAGANPALFCRRVSEAGRVSAAAGKERQQS